MSTELALAIVQLALKYGPGLAKSVHDMFVQKTFTPQDWEKLFNSMTSNANRFMEETKGSDGNVTPKA